MTSHNKIYYLFLLIFLCLVLTCQSPNSKKGINSFPPEILERGKNITTLAQKELMSALKSAIDSGGTAFALRFCNSRAMPLTDSLSKSLDCRINRIALRNRNPTNAVLTAEERLLLNEMLEKSMEGNTLNDTIISDSKHWIYYRPILIANETCLRCHGKINEDIDVETMMTIHELYPNDKATNYRLGDFRGSWRLLFPK